MRRWGVRRVGNEGAKMCAVGTLGGLSEVRG